MVYEIRGYSIVETLVLLGYFRLFLAPNSFFLFLLGPKME